MQVADHFSALLTEYNKQLDGLFGAPRYTRAIELARECLGRSSTEFERTFWSTVIAKMQGRL